MPVEYKDYLFLPTSDNLQFSARNVGFCSSVQRNSGFNCQTDFEPIFLVLLSVFEGNLSCQLLSLCRDSGVQSGISSLLIAYLVFSSVESVNHLFVSFAVSKVLLLLSPFSFFVLKGFKCLSTSSPLKVLGFNRISEGTRSDRVLFFTSPFYLRGGGQ